MIKPKSITEQILFSTVRIESHTDEGISYGTGFIFNIRHDIPVIITNKHVVVNSKGCSLYFHETIDRQTPSDNSINLRIACKWIDHPDKEVDLCASFVAPFLNHAATNLNKQAFFKGVDDSIIWSDDKLSDELKAVENILMFGYPNALMDSKNNLPLVRSGITASHPAVNFEGKSIGVIDAACFSGSSGSPIFLINEGSYQAKNGSFNVGANRVILLGVLFGGPTMDSQGDIEIEEIPTSTREHSIHKLMINLGYYIKAKEILVLKKKLLRRIESSK
jgi:hypothetical protein